MDPIQALNQSLKDRKLTLFVGAGISMGNGLPSWQALVVAMYYKVMSRGDLGFWRPFPNYLMAISQWQLENLNEPLEISARKIRLHFEEDQAGFRKLLKDTLYEGFLSEGDDTVYLPGAYNLLSGNPTLASVFELIDSHQHHIASTISYNYDSLLEYVLEDRCVPVWEAGQRPDEGQLPIYHVHGFVPAEERNGSAGSSAEDIVFTEGQYNRVANDPYAWSSLVQLHSLSGTVGLMIGLSLDDRNMRRLLDAIRRAPLQTRHYALLKKPTWQTPKQEELERINDMAMQYFDKFAQSGVKRAGTKIGMDWAQQIAGILKSVEERSFEYEEKVLNELGVTPIWYERFEEIPDLLSQIEFSS